MEYSNGVDERHRRRRYRVFPSEQLTGDRSTTDGQIRRRPPSFSEVERLLEIYVATGEGQGSYLAAKVWEERKGPFYLYKNESEIGQHYGSSSSRRHSADSSDAYSDGHPGGRPPSQGGPPGGSEGDLGPTSHMAHTKTRLPSVVRQTDRYDGNHVRIIERRPTHASRLRDDRVWIPLRMTRDEERRSLRVGEYDPRRRTDYEPDFAGAAYIDDRGPQPINTLRPASARAEWLARRRTEEDIIVDQGIEVPAGPRRWRYQAHVDDAPEGEDDREPLYADLPPQEDDSRANSQTQSSRRRQSSGTRTTNRIVAIRGGGLDYDPEETRSGGDGPNFLRLRGGGPGAQPPTGTSALAPDSDEIDIAPRKIE
jgi:hypothetical protein